MSSDLASTVALSNLNDAEASNSSTDDTAYGASWLLSRLFSNPITWIIILSLVICCCCCCLSCLLYKLYKSYSSNAQLSRAKEADLASLASLGLSQTQQAQALQQQSLSSGVRHMHHPIHGTPMQSTPLQGGTPLHGTPIASPIVGPVGPTSIQTPTAHNGLPNHPNHIIFNTTDVGLGGTVTNGTGGTNTPSSLPVYFAPTGNSGIFQIVAAAPTNINNHRGYTNFSGTGSAELYKQLSPFTNFSPNFSPVPMTLNVGNNHNHNHNNHHQKIKHLSQHGTNFSDDQSDTYWDLHNLKGMHYINTSNNTNNGQDDGGIASPNELVAIDITDSRSTQNVPNNQNMKQQKDSTLHQSSLKSLEPPKETSSKESSAVGKITIDRNNYSPSPQVISRSSTNPDTTNNNTNNNNNSTNNKNNMKSNTNSPNNNNTNNIKSDQNNRKDFNFNRSHRSSPQNSKQTTPRTPSPNSVPPSPNKTGNINDLRARHNINNNNANPNDSNNNGNNTNNNNNNNFRYQSIKRPNARNNKLHNLHGTKLQTLDEVATMSNTSAEASPVESPRNTNTVNSPLSPNDIDNTYSQQLGSQDGIPPREFNYSSANESSTITANATNGKGRMMSIASEATTTTNVTNMTFIKHKNENSVLQQTHTESINDNNNTIDSDVIAKIRSDPEYEAKVKQAHMLRDGNFEYRVRLGFPGWGSTEVTVPPSTVGRGSVVGRMLSTSTNDVNVELEEL